MPRRLLLTVLAVTLCMGASFEAMFLLPVRFARCRSLPVMQVLSVAQFGIAAGTLLSYTVKAVPPHIELALEIQITALAVSSLFLYVVIMACLFGLRGARAEADVASRAPSRRDPHPHQVYREHLAVRGLTPRQAEIASLAAQGYSTPTIAKELTISGRTVENHLAHTYKALNVDGRQELVRHYRLFEGAESTSASLKRTIAGR
jgi:DNA-binding NarL/FixJ family response regulator